MKTRKIITSLTLLLLALPFMAGCASDKNKREVEFDSIGYSVRKDKTILRFDTFSMDWPEMIYRPSSDIPLSAHDRNNDGYINHIFIEKTLSEIMGTFPLVTCPSYINKKNSQLCSQINRMYHKDRSRLEIDKTHSEWQIHMQKYSGNKEVARVEKE